MNVFRSRKKSVGDIDAPRPSPENVPPLPKHSRTLFGKKKQHVEPKKEEIDLSIALPSENDFRTSLLMTNMTQRFSMLREQDDPRTKIGKASDDSVLFPKRVSRMDIFGLGNLDDIAEVSSVTGSFRPPFAQDGRTNSYASDGYDGYASDTGSANGSVMGRSRPGQGNKLFGGRQKVYKIPNNGPVSKSNSRPTSSGNGGRGMGKAVYEDDVSTSLWQQLRAQERSKRSLDFDPNDPNLDGRHSPVLSGYNRNRETSSSTNSNERTSTAATSMTSVHDGSATSLPAMMAKEPARDRPLNKRMYGQGIDQQVHEQQNSAIQRLNSVRGGRGFGSLAASRNGGQRPGAASAASSVRSGSPSPALNPTVGFDFGIEKPTQLNTRDADSGYHGPSAAPSPISPHAGGEPTLVQHLDPADHGKATASGAFNKPKAKYDDQQFAQRQLKLREGRDVSQDTSSRSNTPSERASSRLRKDSDTSAGRGTPTSSFSRARADRSMSRDSDGRQTFNQHRNGQYPSEISDSEDSRDRSSPRRREFDASSRQGSLRSSDSARPSNVWNAHSLDEQHPAFRAPITEEDESAGAHQQRKGAENNDGNFESPTLGRMPGGLSDMVRGHLRAGSDASSVYSDTVPSQSAKHSQHNSIDDTLHRDTEPLKDPAPIRARGGSDLAARAAANSTARFHGISLPNDESTSHTRSPSNDTLMERDAFADELADRRRLVEEKLRNIAESRANFDTNAGAEREESPGRSLGLLKKSASKTSLSNENRMLKKLMPSSGPATPSAEEDHAEMFPRQANGRKTSDPQYPDARLRNQRSDPKSPTHERDIGAERRARHAANMRSPPRPGPGPRGQIEARRQQFAGGVGAMPRDFTERVVSNPDQGKPHFHPAGRARHYSPPRAKETPDQKPVLPPQATQGSRGTSQRATNRSPHMASTSDSRARSRSNEQSSDEFSPRPVRSHDMDSPQMVTPGTYPPPASVPIQAARKRSVSKAEISNPINLVSSTYALSTVDLSPEASLENGMDEIRAAEAANNPPPVPPINPRRRAKETLRKLTRSNTASPESDEDDSQSPNPTLRKQASEGANLRGRIRDRIAMPASPPKNR